VLDGQGEELGGVHRPGVGHLAGFDAAQEGILLGGGERGEGGTEGGEGFSFQGFEAGAVVVCFGAQIAIQLAQEVVADAGLPGAGVLVGGDEAVQEGAQGESVGGGEHVVTGRLAGQAGGAGIILFIRGMGGGTREET